MSNRFHYIASDLRRVVKAAENRGWTFYDLGGKLYAQHANGAICRTHCSKHNGHSAKAFERDLFTAERSLGISNESL